MLYLKQYLDDPGTLFSQSSANQWILERTYLKPNLPKKVFGSTLPDSLRGLEHAANKVADRNDDA